MNESVTSASTIPEELRDKLLRMYSKKTYGESQMNLDKPFNCENFACASDGHSMIVIDGRDDLCAETNQGIIKIAIHTMLDNHDCAKYDIEDLRKILKQFPQEPAWEYGVGECRNCHGYGKIHCFTCGEMRICCECKGTGKADDLKIVHEPEVLMPLSDYRISVDGVLIAAPLLARLLETCNLLGVEVAIRTTMPEPYRSMTWRIGDHVRVGIAPIFDNGESHAFEWKSFAQEESCSANG